MIDYSGLPPDLTTHFHHSSGANRQHQWHTHARYTREIPSFERSYKRQSGAKLVTANAQRTHVR